MSQPPETLHDQYFGHQHLTVIRRAKRKCRRPCRLLDDAGRPTKGWRSLDLKELWAYRELLWVLTMRDIKVRYASALISSL